MGDMTGGVKSVARNADCNVWWQRRITWDWRAVVEIAVVMIEGSDGTMRDVPITIWEGASWSMGSFI